MSAKTHVVVIGGGYAGVIAANRLTQSDEVDESRPASGAG